jgi:transcription elongation factor Elf1
MTDLVKLIASELGDSIIAPNSEVRFCCPFCNSRGKSIDNKYHLYLNTSKRLFMCHRCGTKGKAEKILTKFGLTEEVTVRSWKDVVMSLSFISGKDYSSEEDPNLELEYEVEVIRPEKGLISYKYLTDRGLTEEIIHKYRIVSGTGRYRDRIFIPTFNDNDEMIFWVARGYTDAYWGPKYLNPQTRLRKNYLFNLSLAKKFKDVIITEGVFSAIRAGENAVATFGKIVTREQINLLSNADFETYYIALDGDATEQAVYLADELYSRNKTVKLVNLPYGEDPDSVKDFTKYLNQSSQWDFNLKIQKLLDK